MAPVLAGLWGPEGLEYGNSKPAVNIEITVKNQNGTLATLYTDESKNEQADNPARTDEYGNFSFYARPGDYILDVFGVEMQVLVTIHPDDPTLGGGDGGAGGWMHEQATPVLLVQIVHQLTYSPAGIIAKDTLGNQIEHDEVSWPEPGIMEIRYGVPFSGVINIS